MKSILSFILLLFLLSSCSKQQTKPLHLLKLDNSGLQGLNELTPYQEHAILPHIRGYEITMFSRFEAGKTKSIMRVSYDNQEIFYITPSNAKDPLKSKIKAISIVSDLVDTPFDTKIDQLYSPDLGLKCQETKPKQRICQNGRDTNLFLLFSQRSAKEYRLSEIVWSKDAMY